MLFYIKDESIYKTEAGPQTLMQPAAKSEKIIAKEDQLCFRGTSGSEINGSSIQSKLIEYVGRYTESFGSDLIATFAELQPFLTVGNDPDDFNPDVNHEWVIGVGIRTHGVDHNAFIMSRLTEEKRNGQCYVYPEHNYRKLLAVHIKDEISNENDRMTRTIKLVDITSDCYMLKDKIKQ